MKRIVPNINFEILIKQHCFFIIFILSRSIYFFSFLPNLQDNDSNNINTYRYYNLEVSLLNFEESSVDQYVGLFMNDDSKIKELDTFEKLSVLLFRHTRIHGLTKFPMIKNNILKPIGMQASIMIHMKYSILILNSMRC